MRITLRARRNLLIFGLWTGIALAYASHLYFYHALRDGASSWQEALLESFADWYTWAFLSVPVLAIARRIPLHSIRNGLIHAALSFVISAVQVTLHSAVDQMFVHHSLSVEGFSRAFGVFFARTYHFGLLVYWLIVIARDVIERYKDQQIASSQLEARLAEAQLQALRAQLHPHFLFNTLNTIASLMHQDVEAADRMIVKLSELLRMALSSGTEEEIPVREELEFLRKYLDIEQMRFSDRLQVTFDVASDAIDAAVPCFFLQPIVENCIRHGITPNRNAGTIEIRAVHRNDSLQFSVCDDGKGVPATGIAEGVGLSNTRKRLQQLYGDRYRLVLEPAEGRGTKVVVTIPYRGASR